MPRSYFRWWAVPLLAVGVVIATTALLNFSSRRRLRRGSQARIVADAKAILAGVKRMAATNDAGPRLCVYLNTYDAAVSVPRRHLGLAARELPSLFDCYALACLSEDVTATLKADVWNCVCAIVEESLRLYLGDNPLMVDASAAAASLALCEVLQERYHIFHFLPHSQRVALRLHRLSRCLFAEAVHKNASERSTWRSLVVFAQLLQQSCTLTERLLLGVLVLASATHIPRLLLVPTMQLSTPSKVAYAAHMLSGVAESADGAGTSCCAVARRVLASVPSRLLAGAAVGTLFSHLFAAAQDAASDGLLRRLRASVKTDTLLALARFDFVADATWHVPHRVFAALSDTTNFSLADVDRLCSAFTDGARRCRTVCAAPLPCAVGWATRQGLDLLSRQWTRACLMRSFIGAYAAAAAAAPPASQEKRNVGDHNTGCHESVSQWAHGLESAVRCDVCHFGLQVLLLAAAAEEAPPATTASAQELVAVHTRWPLFPAASFCATQRALRALCRRGNAVLVDKYTAVQALSSSFSGQLDARPFAEDDGVGDGASAPSFSTLLGLRRSSGEDWRSVDWPFQPSPSLRGSGAMWTVPSVHEEVVKKVLVGLDGLPVMTALAARQRQCTALVSDDDDALEVAFSVTKAVHGGDMFAMPPARAFSSGSAFEFDVDVARLRYHDYDAYAQSVAAVLYVQKTHCPLLDHGAPSPFRATPPWRITFDRVSFRYPGSDVDVLHEVSFDVAAGGFLGIVGFSGAGKSTLLLLLSRVYAPTAGHIYINGCSVDCLPPRALRRRLGVTWQGDGHTRFIDGLSVERNVAYGALQRASAATVAQALAAACIDDVVVQRPHGTRAVLQSDEWSGGELDRLALAQALMVAPDEAGAYLFDECTSGLDAVTESRVFENAQLVRGYVTQIMVSHRLSSVQHANEILVLAHGRIVERGTWTDLLALGKESLFYALYAAQTVG
ncbi:ABC transporter family-like protein [Lotmaria passim]